MEERNTVCGSVTGRMSGSARAPRLLVLFALAILAFTVAAAPATARPAKRRAHTLLKVIEEVKYGPSSADVANIYPSSTPGSPVVILVHGGGWRKQGPLGRYELHSRGLQSEGSTAVEINYDQDTPSTPAFPMEPNAVIAAVHWAVAHAAAYNGDPATIVLLGASAGGNLVAIAAEELAVSNPGLIDAVVMLSGPTDFVGLMGELEENTIGNESFNTSVHRALGFNSPGSESFPQAYAERWSPALHVHSAACPSWLIFNSTEEFVPFSQAQEMAAALQKAKCPVTLEPVEGEEHAFLYFRHEKPTIFSFIAGL